MGQVKKFVLVWLCVLCHLTVATCQNNLSDIIKRYDQFQDAESELHKTSWPITTSSNIIPQVAFYTSLKNELDQIANSNLDNSELINFEMLNLILDDALYNLNYGTHLMPLSSEGGFIISMIYTVNSKQLNNPQEVEHYLAKVKTTNVYLESQIKNLQEGLESKIVRPQLVVNNCLEILNDLLRDEKDFFLFQPFKEVMEIDQQLKNDIYNGFIDLKDFLENDYLPLAPKDIGISKNKNGKDFYEQRVRYYTTLDMTPQEVYDLGHLEVARIRAEMEQIITDLNFEGDFEAFTKYLREDEQFYAKSGDELLYYASWLSKKAEEILPRYFGKLPRLPFTVTPVPLAIAPNYTTGRYSDGSMENKKAGQYWVNTYNLPSRPLYVLPSLTLHEAVPGHHLQISLAKELLDLPDFRSHYLSAFGEGWGLYSEYLGKEAGIYKTKYEEFGRLTYEMWRACRLVVDPGMHYFGMSREDALEFMRSNTALSMHEINTEINRYIGWPGQAVSYKIGELKIRELRARAEEELADKFDIRRFHDLVLSNGSIPLNTLERVVINFIEDEKRHEKKN